MAASAASPGAMWAAGTASASGAGPVPGMVMTWPG